MTKYLAVLVLVLGLSACAGAHSATPQVLPALPVQPGAPSTRWVGTHGIEVAVPAAWKLGRGICGTPQANTVLWNEDGINLCLTTQPLGLSVVEFNGYLEEPHGWYRQHTTPVTIDGIHGRRWNVGTARGSHEVQLAFPDRNISVALLSPSRALLRRILASVRLVRVDLNGCPTHPAPLFRRGSRQGASKKPFVPPGAVGLVGCSYDGRWIDDSKRLGRRAATRLAHALDQAPFGFSGARHNILRSACGSTFRGSLIIVHFRYAGERPSRPVAAHLIGCTHLGASNGRWGILRRRPWVNLITQDAGYAGALIPVPR